MNFKYYETIDDFLPQVRDTNMRLLDGIIFKVNNKPLYVVATPIEKDNVTYGYKVHAEYPITNEEQYEIFTDLLEVATKYTEGR